MSLVISIRVPPLLPSPASLVDLLSFLLFSDDPLASLPIPHLTFNVLCVFL
jgi:hypothetical protein